LSLLCSFLYIAGVGLDNETLPMKKLLAVFLIMAGLMLWTVSQVISSQPVAVKPQQGNIDSAQQVKILLRKIRYKIRTPPRKFSLRVSAAEIDAIGRFANRAIPRLRVQTELAEAATQIAISLQMPSSLSGWFVNFQISILPSSKGVQIERFSVGNLEFDSQWSFALLTSIADRFTDGVVSELLGQITAVKMQYQSVTVFVSPNGSLRQQLNQLAGMFGLEDNGHEKEAIRHYHEFLVQLAYRLPKQRNLSLLAYLKPLINEAASRSKLSSAAEENRTALLALGYFAGHRHFAGVIGSFAELESKLAKTPHQLLLAGRHDLQQHFLYSIIFKLLSDRGVSFMLGELKEMMDSGRGGSGFSFADLAADLSGNQFAQYATGAETAASLQNNFASKINERWIFPAIGDLEEGLSKQAFKEKYSEVDSPRYLAVVEKIQARIDLLPLYQSDRPTETGGID
jgi:hypothetical protein